MIHGKLTAKGSLLTLGSPKGFSSNPDMLLLASCSLTHYVRTIFLAVRGSRRTVSLYINLSHTLGIYTTRGLKLFRLIVIRDIFHLETSLVELLILSARFSTTDRRVSYVCAHKQYAWSAHGADGCGVRDERDEFVWVSVADAADLWRHLRAPIIFLILEDFELLEHDRLFFVFW